MLDIYRPLRANGQSYVGATRNNTGILIGDLGGGSGGIIPFFFQTLLLAEISSIFSVGGNGGLFGGGKGGGGRVHFHWFKIDVGDDSRYAYHDTRIKMSLIVGPVQILSICFLLIARYLKTLSILRPLCNHFDWLLKQQI